MCYVRGLVCGRCKHPVTKSEVEGYSYYCPEHDEDLVSFEVDELLEIEILKCKEIIKDGYYSYYVDYLIKSDEHKGSITGLISTTQLSEQELLNRVALVVTRDHKLTQCE